MYVLELKAMSSFSGKNSETTRFVSSVALRRERLACNGRVREAGAIGFDNWLRRHGIPRFYILCLLRGWWVLSKSYNPPLWKRVLTRASSLCARSDGPASGRLLSAAFGAASVRYRLGFRPPALGPYPGRLLAPGRHPKP
jgi:hypothetical protein